MSWATLLRVFRQPGIHVVYGQAGSCKTGFSLNVCLSASRSSRVLYVGLARHSLIHPRENSNLIVVGIPNLKSEMRFLLGLDLIPSDVGGIIYDSFSAYFIPLRFYMRESSIAKLQLFALSKLYSTAQTRNIPVILTVQEVSGKKPLAFRVLKRYSRDFTRLEKTGEKIIAHVYDKNLEERFSVTYGECRPSTSPA